jgi:hypothetical protein
LTEGEFIAGRGGEFCETVVQTEHENRRRQSPEGDGWVTSLPQLFGHSHDGFLDHISGFRFGKPRLEHKAVDELPVGFEEILPAVESL